MSVAVPANRSFDTLTERELLILSMLASGHTAKTIAAELGCSEASINERLRDARRKTGATSSRALARLLDARKTWDSKIDLPAGDPTHDRPSQPAQAGPKVSRGRFAMLLIAPIAIAALVAVAPFPSTQAGSGLSREAASEASPFIGTWALNVARIPAAERPKRVIFTFRTVPDRGLSTRVEIVAPDGGVTHAESTAAFDGVPVAITGNMTFADTVALRQPAPNTVVMTFASNGVPVSTRVYTVAKDRKSMTETIVWNHESSPRMVTTYFNRVS